MSTLGAPRLRLQCFRSAAKSCNMKVLMRVLSGVKGSGNLYAATATSSDKGLSIKVFSALGLHVWL